MKLGIFACAPRCYSVQRLFSAADEHGHAVRVINPLNYLFGNRHNEEDSPWIGDPQLNFDAVIPRIGARNAPFGREMLRRLERNDVIAVNRCAAIALCLDKLRVMQLFKRQRIGIPETDVVSDRESVVPAINRVGGLPVSIKVIEGKRTVRVLFADSIEVVNALIETLRTPEQTILVQKIASECGGRDIRAMVVGDTVVSAIYRNFPTQEVRNSQCQGAPVEAAELPEEYCATAVRAAEILGLQIAAVDMLHSNAGPLVTDVDETPDLKVIERATGADIASAIINYVTAQVDFREASDTRVLKPNPEYRV